jgi:medium-chain acyl-[acyl-carrier-protein] hydrolase
MPDHGPAGAMTADPPWLRWPRRRPEARWRLLCFPHAGSGPAPYLGWAPLLGDDIEVVAVCLPGRERRLGERRYRRMDPLIAEFCADVMPMLRPPYLFFGHSLGALIAFELCRVLEQRQEAPPPAHLFVSGCGAPHLPRARSPAHALAEGEFLARVREFEGLPDAVIKDREMLALVMPVLRDDFELAETYAPGRRQAVRAPLTAISGALDRSAPPASLDAWGDLALGRFRARTVPGGHFYLTDSARPVIEVIRDSVAGPVPR